MSNKHEKALINFKKTKSLLEKMIKMIEDGEYCVDIMQQNLSAIGLLRSAHQQLMEGHLTSCFANAMKTSNEERKQQMIEEILAVSKFASK